jgi:hypothetical protein
MENKQQGPSAAITLILVFAVPIAVFVGSAFACKYLLAPYIAGVTLAALYAVRRLIRRN